MRHVMLGGIMFIAPRTQTQKKNYFRYTTLPAYMYTQTIAGKLFICRPYKRYIRVVLEMCELEPPTA
jgi:hypothetical protein